MAFQVIDDGTSDGGGGGGTVTTGNGLSGDGSVGTPVVLGGTLTGDTSIVLNAHDLNFTGNQSFFDVNDTLDSEAIQLTFANAGGDSGGISMGHGIRKQVYFENAGLQAILFGDTTGAFTNAMLVEDQVNNTGFANIADYSANTTPTRLAQYNELGTGFPSVVSSVKVTGVAASDNLITFTVPSATDFTYRISFNMGWRAGVGAASLTLTWTDELGNVNVGTIASLTGAGVTSASPIVIEAQASSQIFLNANITGTAIADYYCYIEILG